MQPHTVLVVDDHVDSRVICEIILSRAGYQTLSAGEGQRGVELARAYHPDAILLDIALPGMDGWMVIGELQKEPATARIPVLLYTAHSLDSDRLRAERLGCAGYLVKPCSPQTILDAVHDGIRCAVERDAEPDEVLPEPT
jgi:two-component system cell cycle response regulator DivK